MLEETMSFMATQDSIAIFYWSCETAGVGFLTYMSSIFVKDEEVATVAYFPSPSSK